MEHEAHGKLFEKMDETKIIERIFVSVHSGSIQTETDCIRHEVPIPLLWNSDEMISPPQCTFWIFLQFIFHNNSAFSLPYCNAAPSVPNEYSTKVTLTSHPMKWKLPWFTEGKQWKMNIDLTVIGDFGKDGYYKLKERLLGTYYTCSLGCVNTALNTYMCIVRFILCYVNNTKHTPMWGHL